MRAGAVVLAGGRSSRMGQSKALLDWHGRPAIVHAVATAREGVAGGPVVVVRAPGQELPLLAEVTVTEDAVAGDGPLRAFHAGLVALGGRADVAFVCAVDTPLLHPSFVQAVVAALREGDDAVVPWLDGRAQPLLAVYRTALVATVAELLGAGARGFRDLVDVVAVRTVTDEELGPGVDLRAALNANTPGEWRHLANLPPR